MSPPFPTVVAMFEHVAARFHDGVAVRHHDGESWVGLTWAQWRDRARAVAAQLIRCGFRHGDRVALMARPSPEWLIVDMGAQMAGCAVVSIYERTLAEQCAWILEDARVRAVFVDSRVQLAKLASVAHRVPNVERIVALDAALAPALLAELGNRAESLDRFEADGAAAPLPEAVAERIAATRFTATCAIVYTSGVTGPPRGVLLTHGNLVQQSEAVQSLGLTEKDVQLLYVPLSHAFGRMLQLASLRSGGVLVLSRGGAHVLDDAKATTPTVLAAVPRLFEAIYGQVADQARRGGGLKRLGFDWSASVAAEVAEAHVRGEPMDLGLRFRAAVMRRALGRQVDVLLGGRMRLLISGQGLLAQEISRFFYGIGTPVLEGYGLTETAGATHVNRLDQIRFGTVGAPLPGVEVKLTAGGEVLVRGPSVMAGYNNAPERTAAVFSPGGWLKTGDLGSVDDDGFLTVVGRKRERIRAPSGDVVWPIDVENRLQTSPWISRAMVYGDRREFLTALLTLDLEAVGQWARGRGLKTDRHVLAGDPDVYALVSAAVDQANAELPGYAAVRKFALLERDFSLETGELTSTEKLRRRFIAKQHADLLDSFYREQY